MQMREVSLLHTYINVGEIDSTRRVKNRLNCRRRHMNIDFVLFPLASFSDSIVVIIL